MGGFFYENKSGLNLDGQNWDGGPLPGSPYNCFRNVTGSTISNSRMANCKLRSSSDHVEGLKVDLATRCKLYRTLFENNDVMHLFFSYPFWGSSLNGVSHPDHTDDFLVEECGFGDLASTYGQPKYFHVQVTPTHPPTRLRFKNCFALEGIGFLGGNTTGVVVENLMWVPKGSSVREAMDNWARDHGTTPPPPPPPPDPEPGPTGEQRLTVLEALVADFSADLAQVSAYGVDTRAITTGLTGRVENVEVSKATRPDGLDVKAINDAIAAIKAANPKIAQSDSALRDALINLANTLRT